MSDVPASDPAVTADYVAMTPEEIADLIRRLDEAADPSNPYTDVPWWWDAPDRGGPAQLLREAANALEAILRKMCDDASVGHIEFDADGRPRYAPKGEHSDGPECGA
jgi:hypothetical protein